MSAAIATKATDDLSKHSLRTLGSGVLHLSILILLLHMNIQSLSCTCIDGEFDVFSVHRSIIRFLPQLLVSVNT